MTKNNVISASSREQMTSPAEKNIPENNILLFSQTLAKKFAGFSRLLKSGKEIKFNSIIISKNAWNIS